MRECEKAGMKVIERTIVQKFYLGAVRSRACEEESLHYRSSFTVNVGKGSLLCGAGRLVFNQMPG